MGILDKLKSTFSGGDDELSRDDLLREVESGILALQRHGRRGREVFPPGVRVGIVASGGSLEALRAFVADPAFERDLEARLRNRLVDPEDLPARRYEVEAGEVSSVVVEDDPVALQGLFVVTGGDEDGARYPIELTRREWRLGRGPWHQEREADQRLPNDVVVTTTLPWVSRAAAIVRRTGSFLEVESRQQGEFLLVVRRDGTQVRPAMTAAGRTALAPGDRLVFHDGGTGRVEIKVEPC